MLLDPCRKSSKQVEFKLMFPFVKMCERRFEHRQKQPKRSFFFHSFSSFHIEANKDE